MREGLRMILARELRQLAENIELDKCEATDEQGLDVLDIIRHKPMYKEQSYEYLGLGRSRFDDLVRDGILPKGRKDKGGKLYWYQDELDKAIRDYKVK